jgi:DNA-binding CsgD family transcriptional regulator
MRTARTILAEMDEAGDFMRDKAIALNLRVLPDEELTNREVQCIFLQSRGWPPQLVAKALDISTQTAKNHIHYGYSRIGSNLGQRKPDMLAARYIWERYELPLLQQGGTDHGAGGEKVLHVQNGDQEH